ncbi:MAG TPA: hypothetical protein VFZ53_27060 [Polyangiaceae bacterium]
MPRGVRISVLVAVLVAALPGSARADGPRIGVSATPACRAAASELESRVERALDGAHATELEATVTIEPNAAGYRAVVATRHGPRHAGTTAISAPTCEEAVDAAIEVLSLALREDRPEGAAAPRPPEPGPPVVAAAAGFEPSIPVMVRPSKRVDRGEPRRAEPSGASAASTRVSLATGAELGTLPDPTLIVSGAVARSLSLVDVRAVLRYGLPTVHETVETGFTESVRREFAALELRACRGTGATVRVSLCAGGEVGFVRATHRLDTGAQDSDETTTAPRVAGTLAAQFSHAGGLIEPELELAGAAVAYGGDPAASWLAVRVTAGAAVAF